MTSGRPRAHRVRRRLILALITALAIGTVSPAGASTKFAGVLTAHVAYSEPLPLSGGVSVTYAFDTDDFYLSGSFRRADESNSHWTAEVFGIASHTGASTAPESLAGGQGTGSFSRAKTDKAVSCTYSHQRTGAAALGAMTCSVTDAGQTQTVSGPCRFDFTFEPSPANAQQFPSAEIVAACDLGLSVAPNVVVNPTGNATADHVAVSGTGCATATDYGVAVSGTGCANSDYVSASGGGNARGWYAASGTGCATTPYLGGVAASGTGCASAPQGVAASAAGNASNSLVAVSGTGCATGGYAVAASCADGTYGEVRGIGDASAQDLAVSGTGCASAPGDPDTSVSGLAAASGTGCANAKMLAASAAGNATGGGAAASGAGDSCAKTASVSGSGDANPDTCPSPGALAVSGIGQANGETAQASGEDEGVYVQGDRVTKTYAKRDLAYFSSLDYVDHLVGSAEAEALSANLETPGNEVDVSEVTALVITQLEDLSELQANIGVDPLTGRAHVDAYLGETELVYEEVNLLDPTPLDPVEHGFSYSSNLKVHRNYHLVWNPDVQKCHCHRGDYWIPVFKERYPAGGKGRYWWTAMNASVKAIKSRWFGEFLHLKLWPTSDKLDLIEVDPLGTVRHRNSSQSTSINVCGDWRAFSSCVSSSWTYAPVEIMTAGRDGDEYEIKWADDSPGMCPGAYMTGKGAASWWRTNSKPAHFWGRGQTRWEWKVGSYGCPAL